MTEEHHEPTLTDEELRQLRALMLADARRQWLVTAIKGVSIWVAALAAGYLALKGLLLEFMMGGGR